MSMIRQLWLLLVATVVIGVVGSTAVGIGSARAHLQTALRLKNSDNAQALAIALSQQRGDPTAAELLIAAQFDTGYYDSIRLLAPEGRVLVERRAAAAKEDAPDWFVRLVPIESEPGIAQVSAGWKALGSLEVVSTARFAHADLWRGSLRSALWLAGVGLLLGVAGAFVLGRIRRPLQTTVAQAEALIERRFVTMPEPAVPELRRLAAAMNALVRRLQSIFGEQDRQLEALRREAQVDAVTGLAQRAHFLDQVESLLARKDAARSGWLMLLRLPGLAAMNRRYGHHAVDRWLALWADHLQAQLRHRPDVRIGRLNGSDIAVIALGPARELAAEATALYDALRSPLGGLPAVDLALGAAGWSAGAMTATLMREADAALAQAETRPDGERALFVTGGEGSPHDAPQPEAVGESVWRQRLAEALARGDARLGEFAVVARDGTLLHLEAPLRLKFDAQADELPAARWLAWAIRTRLVGEADLCAVQLGLRAISLDGRPRAINLAPESLADGEFIAALHEALRGQPQAAKSLMLEVGERAAIDRLPLVRELARLVQPLGVKVGLEHAGERLGRIDRLYEAHLDYVKLDRSVTAGLAAQPRRGEFVRGLVWMLHGLGIAVHAEGVSDAADAAALWQCGIDGQTGPWVTGHQPASAG